MRPDLSLTEADWLRIPADLREKLKMVLERRDRRVVETPATDATGLTGPDDLTRTVTVEYNGRWLSTLDRRSVTTAVYDASTGRLLYRTGPGAPTPGDDNSPDDPDPDAPTIVGQ